MSVLSRASIRNKGKKRGPKMMKIREKLRNQRGGSAVEFAIILFVLLLIVFGIIEFGLIFYNKQVITNASREGARFGIVSRVPRYTDNEVAQVIYDYCQGRLYPQNSTTPPTVTVSAPSGTGFGSDLEVSVSWPYDFIFLPDFLMGQPLFAKTVMKYE
jgi:Flp pilus assembly protein TadG